MYICLLWNFYANAAGIGLLSIGISFLLVLPYDIESPVFEHSTTVKPQLVTPTIKRGGHVIYVVHTRQNQSCPGDIVTTFTSKTERTDQPPAVVTIRRPITRSDIGVYRDFPVALDVPDTVWPGKWTMTVAADSHCPLRSQTSTIAEFDLEVTS
jgi:hypothetical protein